MQYFIFLMIIMSACFSQNNFCFSKTHRKSKIAVSPGEMKIVNGRDAKPDEFPYQVMVGVLENGELIQECGGSILDERHILTAAHCVYKYRSTPENLRVVVGDIAQQGESRHRQEKSIEQVYVHADYKDNREIIPFDIALLRTDERMIMNNGVQPIKMPRRRIRRGICVVSGWGAMEDGSKDTYPEILQAVNVPLIDFDQCKRLSSTRNGNKIEAGVICAGYREGGQDSCDGDSGGPLMCQNVLVGISSWGDECAAPGKPGYYTEVFYYKDWIENKLEESWGDDNKRRTSLTQ